MQVPCHLLLRLQHFSNIVAVICWSLRMTLVHVDCLRLNLVDCSWRNLEPKNYILVAANVTCSTWNEIRNFTEWWASHGYQHARSLVTTLRFDIPQSVLTQMKGLDPWSRKSIINDSSEEWWACFSSYLCLSHMLRFPCNAIGPISKRGPDVIILR